MMSSDVIEIESITEYKTILKLNLNFNIHRIP